MADTFDTKHYVIATAAFADGTAPTDLVFRTDNEAVATVQATDPTGAALQPNQAAIVAQTAGSTVLTATGGGKTATVAITVTQADSGDLIITLSDPLPKP